MIIGENWGDMMTPTTFPDSGAAARTTSAMSGGEKRIPATTV